MLPFLTGSITMHGKVKKNFTLLTPFDTKTTVPDNTVARPDENLIELGMPGRTDDVALPHLHLEGALEGLLVQEDELPGLLPLVHRGS